MKVAVTPSATPLLTREPIFKMKEAGLVRLGISLDGSTPEIHDAFRGLPGAWARTIQAIEWANEAGIPIQVHTTISRHNANDLDNLCALFEKLAIVMWNVFFLVPVGRGQLDDLLSGEEFEQVFGKIYELVAPGEFPDQDDRGDALPSLSAAAQSGREAHGTWASGRTSRNGDAGIRAGSADRPMRRPGRRLGHAPRERWQGIHVCFARGQCVSQRISAHSCRQHPRDAAGGYLSQCAHLQSAARHGQARRQMRRVRVQGDLRRSRARAYAVTGDPLAQEPCCIYQPKNWHPLTDEPAESKTQAAWEPLVTL